MLFSVLWKKFMDPETVKKINNLAADVTAASKPYTPMLSPPQPCAGPNPYPNPNQVMSALPKLS